ncbi:MULTISPECIES: DUF4235 domain-containing protein [Nocardiopsis]|uniref:DUF4235 domain-containing protein n=2 Tax=Nocardiopsis alba TaxID=53437 RepID=A0A7K2IMC5_9ACTN|nr:MULTISPECIES: DUF4235 domain-containing protein [Nocardiopsis]AFR09846.1 hypothetical protein B005_5427 [Nocardiopsis alba ATCC BAA-2165]MEC3894503.1 DUF4235 domain-containing protein [Nocardiopsis sp. LDBS1602]MYR30987.1 DUF4235 domain-containing protein [Nocardiopsis alba]
MAKKDGEVGPVVLGLVAGFAAEFVTRKALTFAWTRATGEEPPTDLESPEVSLGRALSWAVVAGVGVEVARVLAVRAARKQLTGGGSQESGS